MTGPARFGPGSRGVWLTDAAPASIAGLARAGFDWLCVDLQHGRYGRHELLDIARGHPADGAALIARVPSVEFTGIGLALDAGVAAVIVPQVDTVADAEQAVAATYYPPIGRRSFGQLFAAWRPAQSLADANRTVGCAVMIESATALANVEAIAAVPGLSMLFIGPNDLSFSLGTTPFGLLADTSDDSPMTRIVAAARANGLLVGAYAGEPRSVPAFRSFGVDAISVATDTGLLRMGAEDALRLTATT